MIAKWIVMYEPAKEKLRKELFARFCEWEKQELKRKELEQEQELKKKELQQEQERKREEQERKREEQESKDMKKEDAAWIPFMLAQDRSHPDDIRNHAFHPHAFHLHMHLHPHSHSHTSICPGPRHDGR